MRSKDELDHLIGRTESELAVLGSRRRRTNFSLPEGFQQEPSLAIQQLSATLAVDEARNRMIAEDEERLIVATGRYLGEGYDDARLDTLFRALPISWRVTLAQYAGRLHRLNETKKEVVSYDYVNFNVSVLAKKFDKRRRGYRAIGYDIVI